MSFICVMVVGYFDPAQGDKRQIPTDRLLVPGTVRRLQAACDERFAINLRLADSLTESGLLVIQDIRITDDMFRVACVAHELFGMVAVDVAHRAAVYPRPDWKPAPLHRLIDWYRRSRSDWDEATVRQHAESIWEWELRQAEFERGVIQRVRSALEPPKPPASPARLTSQRTR